MSLPFPLPPVIFFDAVGTLIHPEPAATTVYVTIGRHFGSRLEEAEIAPRFRAAFRRQEEVHYANGLRTSEQREIARWRAIVGEVLDDVSDAEACFQALYLHFSRADTWRCVPGTTEALATLAARGHMLGIASNFDHRLRGIVEQMPPLRPVRHLVISSEIGWSKPAVDFFSQMCRQAVAPAEQILYVGDDPVNDYEGAKAAGLQAVLFDPRDNASHRESDCIASWSDLL